MAARTGKTIWTSEGRQAEGAAILSAEDALFSLTNQAKLIAFAKSESEYKPLASYQVAGSPTWAHPVIWERNILVKDETNLTLWSFE
jgi:hypothetical protein